MTRSKVVKVGLGVPGSYAALIVPEGRVDHPMVIGGPIEDDAFPAVEGHAVAFEIGEMGRRRAVASAFQFYDPRFHGNEARQKTYAFIAAPPAFEDNAVTAFAPRPRLLERLDDGER